MHVCECVRACVCSLLCLEGMIEGDLDAMFISVSLFSNLQTFIS